MSGNQLIHLALPPQPLPHALLSNRVLDTVLSLICDGEARGILERVMLKAWKHPPTWEARGLVPSKTTPARGGGCELAFDE
jgi:hypothetical protein